MKLRFNGANTSAIGLDQKGYRKVMTRALNKVIRSVEVRANRNIREQYNIKRKDVDDALSLRLGSISKLQAVITARGKRLPVVLFGARQTRPGVTVMITKGARKTIKHSFLATLKSGHAGVFARLGKPRLPIKELTTISIADMFGKSANVKDLDKFAAEKLPEVLEHELSFYLSERAGGGGN